MKSNIKGGKINNVAKVKIMLSSNKHKQKFSTDQKSSNYQRTRTNLYQPHGIKKSNEGNLKSISNKVKQAMTTQKFSNGVARPSFKAQTTRAVANLKNNTKSNLKKKEKYKESRLGLLNKSNKYTGVRGLHKPLLGSHPRDGLKRRNQNKTIMNY